MTTEREMIAQARKQWAPPAAEPRRMTLAGAALGMVAGLLVALLILWINGYLGPPIAVAPGPTYHVLTRAWDCTVTYADAKWQWPVCDPVKP